LEPIVDQEPPQCPVCAGPLVVRVARNGPNAGREFLGCTRWPSCQGTRSLAPVDDDPPPALEDCLSVARFNQLIRGTLGATFRNLWIAGEITSVVERSGHIFAGIRDEAAQLSIVIWRDDVLRLAVRPEQGMHVLVHGRASLNTRRSAVEFVVDRMVPQGRGAYELALRQLREQLTREGLFEQSRKRQLPKFPMCIGVVTSPDGAALQDIAAVLLSRSPHVSTVLSPTTVQGPAAPTEIVRALRLIQGEPVDLIILGRGGGANEDLAAFNQEAVVRAIAASHVPVISAVGHEIDTTLADLVADLRAPTPSAAAEMASPATAAVQRDLDAFRDVFVSRLTSAVSQKKEQHHALSRRLVVVQRRGLAEDEQRLRQLSARHVAATRGRFTELRLGLGRLAPTFERLPSGVTIKALHLKGLEPRLSAATGGRLNECGLAYARWRTYDFPPARARIGAARMDAESLHERLTREATLSLGRGRLAYETIGAMLDAYSPVNVLRRGYALVRTQNGTVVRSAQQIQAKDVIRLSFAVGAADVEVVGTNDEEGIV
jgi:exodeoxyribonuclease VII large subunit